MAETLAQPISILVIEDDPGDFGLIRAHVRMTGLAQGGGKEPVTWAKTLAEGIAAARSRKPDVVLLGNHFIRPVVAWRSHQPAQGWRPL